mmetsp:Transcript_27059/g.85031  ORF Transcript_27059/g.85031 Transcript_27059/m.85031 type:complete len:202 (-) Transcript_27059:123-728(-)
MPGWQETPHLTPSSALPCSTNQPPQQNPRSPIFPAPRARSAGRSTFSKVGCSSLQGRRLQSRMKKGRPKNHLASLSGAVHNDCFSVGTAKSPTPVPTHSPPAMPPFGQNTGATTRTPRSAAMPSQICSVRPLLIPKTSCATRTAAPLSVALPTTYICTPSTTCISPAQSGAAGAGADGRAPSGQHAMRPNPNPNPNPKAQA